MKRIKKSMENHRLRLKTTVGVKVKTSLRKYVLIAGGISVVIIVAIIMLNSLLPSKDIIAINGNPVINKGDLIITEVGAAGHLGISNNEYIELYNNTPNAMNLSGCTIKYYTTSLQTPVLALSGTINPWSYFVIAIVNGKGNTQPSGALPYQLQVPSPGWKFSDNSGGYLELLYNSTIIDNAGNSLQKFSRFENYDRTDFLGDGTNIVQSWKKISSTLSSPGSSNYSDLPQVQNVNVGNTFVNFGANSENDAAIKIKNLGNSSLGNTSIKIYRGKVYSNLPPNKTFIKRFVEIEAANQPSNVTLVYSYKDSELNGLLPSSLGLYSFHMGQWNTIGGVVDIVNKTITATNINEFSIWVAGEMTGGGALPIKLLNFEANSKGNSVNINWSTASEINNDYFTIEKSSDGKIYEICDNIRGAGNSLKTLKYSFTDNKPFSGRSYYRLKQTDYDGKFEIFNPVSVVVENQASVSIQKFGPNPFVDDFTVDLHSAVSGNVEINLINIRGQLIKSEFIQLNEGFTSYFFSDGGELTEGQYYLSVKQGQKVIQTIKMIKKQ